MSRRPFGVQFGHATTAAVDLKERPAVARAFNREHGMHALLPGAVRETVLNPLHVLAQVRWSARFEKTGPRATEFEIAYLLELDGESWRILGYVSARDQEEEMRPLGVL